MWWKGRKNSEVFADDKSHSEYEEDGEVEGPTLVTVDDGMGGIKHIKRDKTDDIPPETKEWPADRSSINSDSPRIEESNGAGSPKIGLGDLMSREYRANGNGDTQKEIKNRIVSKRGNINIGKNRISRRRRQYLTDFFNTMLDMQWRYVHLMFFIAFMGSWLGFAIIWWLLIFYHGDFEAAHLPANQTASNWTPCVWNINNFASVFLFSVETQHTIGYGGRMTSEECPEAIIVMCVQSIVGVMIQACMVGIIFSKLSRPKKRASTLMFSRNAVICQRDGTNCLLFRVGNMRHTTLVEAHVRAILISKRVTEEGEVMPYTQTELEVGTDSEGEEDCIFFIWPTTIVHKIDSESPFYGMSARDFLKQHYEIVVILEGVIEQTGNSIQARSSYLPNEVLWGYRFVNLLNFKHSELKYNIDYSAFHSVYRTELSGQSQEAKDKSEEPEEEEEEKEDVVVTCRTGRLYPSLPTSPQLPRVTFNSVRTGERTQSPAEPESKSQ